jgi:hypothetical protein
MNRVVRNSILISITALVLALTSFGGTSTKGVVATQVSTPPKIDGFLNEPEWQSAVPAMGFTQADPEEGSPETERTVVRILYDDNALYVGVMCFDREPDKIVSQLTRRDRTGQSDRFSVMIDSYHDHSTAFLFSGTVSGVESDGFLSQDGRIYDIQWDAVWEFNAQILRDGWSAEFKIPYNALRFSNQDSEYVWGINFRRYLSRKQETDEWVMVPRNHMPIGVISSVSGMGHLSGIRDIHPPLHLELLPYIVPQQNYFSEPAPFSLRKEFKGSAGLDLKYGVTNNFTLDLALNPDFGQVEVDQAVLNLTVFETFYPEKRPLFLEASHIFSFGNDFTSDQLYLFYSRRIGPTLAPQPDSGYVFTQNPQVTKILGAIKFTGKTDNGLSLGVLSALTDQEEGIEENSNGKKNTILFQPRSNYSVVRLRQDISENSFIGFMATSALKDQYTPSYATGVDWNLRFLENQWAFDGYLAGSQAVSPLVTSTMDRVTGTAGKFTFGKVEAEHWVYFTLYDFYTPRFWINDLGFYNQSLEHGGYSQISYKENFAGEPLRRYSLNIDGDYRWDWQGARTLQQIEFTAIGELRNFWSLQTSLLHLFPAFDDANKGIIGLYLRPAGELFQMQLQTDGRDPLIISLGTHYQISSKGMHLFSSDLLLTLRPNSWIELSPGFNYDRVRNEENWVFDYVNYIGYYTDDKSNLFADLDVDSYDFSLKGTVTFQRNVSLQFLTQVYLTKGQYTGYRKLLTPDNLPPYDFLHSSFYHNPDFNQKIINANIVLRWEYLPGSTVYLVWTQARSGDNDLYERDLGQNFSDAFRLPMDNVILAKFTYLLSL